MMTSSLTEQAVAEVASLSKERGRLVLARYLGCKVDDYLHLRDSILLDFHYGNLMVAINSGLTWSQSIEIFLLGKHMLQECTGIKLSEAIDIFQEKIIHLANMITQDKLKLFTDYFFETFMKHYRLYQFVLTQGQEPMASELDIHVIPPVECLKLKEAKTLKVWEYEQKLEELEREEEERKASLTEQMQKEESEIESQKNMTFTSTISGDLNREVISEMIKKASDAQSQHTEKLL
ncbi:uncharacterized protein C8orf74 homolog [Anneissia japonica]|uniref:uncharacterized protein C8orf74 homolog n=1 Tax=Anneissia japonica TaxID=1529436 RepID=UPI001425B9DA|nr:uncharacterized protein C8orf74 homolog [Anneissia japonica]